MSDQNFRCHEYHCQQHLSLGAPAHGIVVSSSSEHTMNHHAHCMPHSCLNGVFSCRMASNNSLTGTLPPFPPNILVFGARSNRLKGAIPAVPKSMVYLHLGNNRLSGAAPSASADHNITFFNMDDNKLSSLPHTFTPPNALYLSVARNLLNSSLSNLGRYTRSLVYADFGGNMLSGSIGDVLQGTQNWLYLAMDNNTLAGSMPTVWPANVSVLLLQNNRIHGCLPVAWTHNNSLVVLELSSNSMSCPQGLPASWANSSSSFQNLSVLSLQGNPGLARNPVPSTWFTQGSFQADTSLRLGELWESSANSRKWRKQVCIKRNFHDRVQTQLGASVAQPILEAVHTRLTAALVPLSQQIYNKSNVVFGTRSLDVHSADLRLSNALQPSLDNICRNPRASLIVTVQWLVMGASLVLLVAVYLLEITWCTWSRLLRSVSGSWGTTSNKGPWLSVAISKLVLLRHPLGLLLYWFDIVLDIALLHQVLAAGARLGYGLLAILVTHYVVMVQLVAWQFVQGSMVRRVVAALAVLPLAPLMPLLDTITFMVVTTLHMFEGTPIVRLHPSYNSWLAKLDGRSEDWMVLFQSREVLEVVLEALPTVVLQSVVFVAGNRPSLGVYLDETLYLLSSVGSCLQILRLTALVLWAAAQQGTSAWRVLWDRLTVKGALRETTAGVP
jgi:hypothetical protein